MIYYRNTLFGSGPKLTAVQEVNLQLSPPNWGTYFKEQMTVAKRNWFFIFFSKRSHL